jgi:hypothetical protein
LKDNAFEITASYFVTPPNRQDDVYGLFEGQIWLSDDFDEPLDYFAEHMQCACFSMLRQFYGRQRSALHFDGAAREAIVNPANLLLISEGNQQEMTIKAKLQMIQ